MSDKSNNKNSSLKEQIFVVSVCFVCALFLSILATALKKPQELAKKLDRSKQMLIAAKILSYQGYFLLPTANGKYEQASFDQQTNLLVPDSTPEKALQKEILQVFQSRIQPRLTDKEGNLFTFEEKGINYQDYLAKNRKAGFAQLPLKLVYEIYPNSTTDKTPVGYVLPVNGYGLWDAIYGYIAIESNADTVIGITWYQQSETAGLGAEIATPDWQKQFTGKLIFQKSPDGTTNFERAPIGIKVLKGKVENILGSSPKAKSAVDGISGASSTGKGVTDAYRDSLEPYRPFLIQLRKRAGASS